LIFLFPPGYVTFIVVTFVDELGFLDVFSVLSEKLKDSLAIVIATSRQQKSILTSHKNPMLSVIVAYKESQHYLSLVPEQGVVVLWNATFDEQCVEYIGHNDAVINIAILPSFEYAPPSLPALELNPRKSSKQREGSRDFGMGMTTGLAVENNNVDSSIALLASGTGLKGFGSERTMGSARSGDLSTPSTGLGEYGGFARDHDLGGSGTSLKICKEENVYFSCSADGVIRCWDEFLRAEMYQFKFNSTDAREVSSKREAKGAGSKGKTTRGSSIMSSSARTPKSYTDIYSSQHVEITCMMMLWDYNCIVTGSEDGVVAIWNADMGNKLISRTLTHTVTALVTASTKKRYLLCSVLKVMWNRYL
jgi:WD40 repeat protein